MATCETGPWVIHLVLDKDNSFERFGLTLDSIDPSQCRTVDGVTRCRLTGWLYEAVSGLALSRVSGKCQTFGANPAEMSLRFNLRGVGIFMSGLVTVLTVNPLIQALTAVFHAFTPEPGIVEIAAEEQAPEIPEKLLAKLRAETPESFSAAALVRLAPDPGDTGTGGGSQT